MTADGVLYFVSPRSYSQTLSTIYSGQFSSGVVTGVHLVAGVSGGTPGTVDFDVEVSSDGQQLYVSVGHCARSTTTLFGGQYEIENVTRP